MRIDPAGWPFVLGALAVALIAAFAVNAALGLVFLTLAGLFLFFFRDPERPITVTPSAVLSPRASRLDSRRDRPRRDRILVAQPPSAVPSSDANRSRTSRSPKNSQAVTVAALWRGPLGAPAVASMLTPTAPLQSCRKHPPIQAPTVREGSG